MRLWHYELIENDLLPASQFLGQWRELNSVFKKQDNHILINYIYNYDKKYLWDYSLIVMNKFIDKKYKISNKSKDNFKSYFEDMGNIYFRDKNEFFKEHNKDYLLTCFMNLREKYKCGQKDFTDEKYNKLRDYIYKRYNGKDGKITIDLYSENFQKEDK